jgi:hypothetical protein
LSDLWVGLRKEVFGPLRVTAKIIMGFALGRVELLVRLHDLTLRAGEITVAMRIDVDDRGWAKVLREAGNGGRKDGAHQQTLLCHGSFVTWCLLLEREHGRS